MLPAALRNRTFARLLASTMLSQFGSSMTFIALPLIAWEQSGSGAVFALVLIGGNLGQLVAFPFGGVIADRFDRRRVGMAGDAISMLLIGGILASVLSEAWLLLALVQLVQNAVNGLTESAAPALRRDVVLEHERTQSNALMQVAMSSSMLAAPLAGAAIYAAWGFGTVIAIDFATFAISFALLAGIRHPQTRAVHPDPGDEAQPTNVLRRTVRDLAGGVGAARRDRFVGVLLAMSCANGVANGFFITSMAPWLDRTIGGATSSFGPLFATFGAAGLAAGLVMTRAGDRYSSANLLRCGAFGWATGSLCLLASPPLAVVFAGFALIGSMATVGNVAMTTILQGRVPSHLMGRLTSLTMCSMLVGSTVSAAVAGQLIDHADPRVPMAGAGLAFITAAACMLVLARRSASPAPLVAIADTDLAVSG